jgi:hypothetical protein
MPFQGFRSESVPLRCHHRPSEPAADSIQPPVGVPGSGMTRGCCYTPTSGWQRIPSIRPSPGWCSRTWSRSSGSATAGASSPTTLTDLRIPASRSCSAGEAANTPNLWDCRHLGAPNASHDSRSTDAGRQVGGALRTPDVPADALGYPTPCRRAACRTTTSRPADGSHHFGWPETRRFGSR